MNKEEIARLLHDEYEKAAKEEGWRTQEYCRVEFDDLPDANKRVMLRIAGIIITKLQPTQVKDLTQEAFTHTSGQGTTNTTQSDAVEFTKWQFMEGYKPKFGPYNVVFLSKDPYLWKRGEQNDFTSEELYAKWKEEQK